MKQYYLYFLMAALIISPNISSWGYTISGSVLDECKTPLPGKQVVLNKQLSHSEVEALIVNSPIDGLSLMCNSDGSGYFVFSNLTCGTYMLSVLSDPPSQKDNGKSYEYYVTKIELSSGNISNVVLIPSSVGYFDLTMELTSAKTGAPFIAGIELLPSSSEPDLSLNLGNMYFLENTKTDERGRTIKRNIPEGRYSIWITPLDESTLSQSKIPLEIQVNHNGSVLVDDMYRQYMYDKGIDLKIEAMMQDPSP